MAEKEKKENVWWSIAAWLFGIFGGFVGYLVLRDEDPEEAKGVLTEGFIFTIVWLIFFLMV